MRHVNPCISTAGLLPKAKVYSPFGESEVSVDYGADRACDIDGTTVFFEGNFRQEDIRFFLDALKVFPRSFIRRFIAGRIFKILPRDEFNALPADQEQKFFPRMGIKIVGFVWAVDEGVLRSKSPENLRQRIWYAVGNEFASDLEREPGFDRPRFMASFNRYMTKRLASPLAEPWRAMRFSLPGVDRLYQLYFNRLAELKSFDPRALRRIFRESLDEYERFHSPVSPVNPMYSDERGPWAARELYDQFVSEGFKWRMSADDYFEMSLQNAKSRVRPQSSHRLNLRYYNDGINKSFGSAVRRVLPVLNPVVTWAPGIVGSYETKTAEGRRKISLLLGSLIDAGVWTRTGRFTVHSYLGWPVSVPLKGGERPEEAENEFEPEWEIGLRYNNPRGNFIAGAMLLMPVGDSERRYLGLVSRMEY